jgi:hypothetical protein
MEQISFAGARRMLHPMLLLSDAHYFTPTGVK